MIADTLAKLVDTHSLNVSEAEQVMGEIMAGNTTASQLGGFLVALRMKGETPDEILGFARAMRTAGVAVEAPDDTIDTCGTGGDFSNSFNISTASAIVAASAGITVAKHGNRSATSNCGSADVLEALGVNIVVSPDQAKNCLEEVGIAFLFAPAFHPAMKHAGPTRSEIGLRTVFNILGPLSNPARVRRQVLGVASPSLGPKMAQILAGLGCDHAMVVHGNDGLDEVTLGESTTIHELREGTISSYEITPEDLGLGRVERTALTGGDKNVNAAIIRALFAGSSGPKRDALIANSAAAILVGGKASDLRGGAQLAANVIDSGAAAQKLDDFVAFTQTLGE